jgi:hypothetical protein
MDSGRHFLLSSNDDNFSGNPKCMLHVPNRSECVYYYYCKCDIQYVIAK